ncbi:short-chain dehydrogenase/reductase SDR [Desulfovibrio sp. X2]|uniref:SDR family oxidoreductase n=1 Tax=Desulfovibrio sp. X2 TaxID=941449 RepID=UPI000358EF48|nr:SDR family oxidoreductase [Desulfovibrio sp. X2]EPR41171.1 short-chain dehydrogenase/reductase SDR [Desulfovibrio sp. X2]
MTPMQSTDSANGRLAGKKALVTGGSRGIGAAIALRLAREGADVAITFTSRPDAADAVTREIREAGVHALAVQADSADAKALAEAVNQAADRLGGLDILVNNAGLGTFGALADYPLEELDRTLAVNTRAAFVAAQAAARRMADGGRIVFIGSCNAERVPFEGATAYAMSKAAIVGLTKGAARDLAARSITVNNVQPGPVDTDLNHEDSDFGRMLKDRVLALPRYADGGEIAALVAYLVGPEAGFVTGASLTIDGGFTA